MSKNKKANRKTVCRSILLAVSAAVRLSAVIVGMCQLSERPTVQGMAANR